MRQDILRLSGRADAQIIRPAPFADRVKLLGTYAVQCFKPDGTLRWEDEIRNLVTTLGKNSMLDEYFEGSAYTAALYMGLVDGASAPTYAAGDTMASHAGWTENQDYSAGTRPAITWNAAAAGSKSCVAVSFTCSIDGTLAGLFIATDSTKGGTGGLLFSEGNFASGNRTWLVGDQVNAQYTLNM